MSIFSFGPPGYESYGPDYRNQLAPNQLGNFGSYDSRRGSMGSLEALIIGGTSIAVGVLASEISGPRYSRSPHYATFPAYGYPQYSYARPSYAPSTYATSTSAPFASNSTMLGGTLGSGQNNVSFASASSTGVVAPAYSTYPYSYSPSVPAYYQAPTTSYYAPSPVVPVTSSATMIGGRFAINHHTSIALAAGTTSYSAVPTRYVAPASYPQPSLYSQAPSQYHQPAATYTPPPAAPTASSSDWNGGWIS